MLFRSGCLWVYASPSPFYALSLSDYIILVTDCTDPGVTDGCAQRLFRLRTDLCRV